MGRVKIKETILVEGRYDKNTLSRIIDANIIVCNGFGIFNDEKKRAYIKDLAEKQGIIILTDSDSAGFIIRNNVKSFVAPEFIKNAYIPQISGKEKRKAAPGREGLLGVEGMDDNTILASLHNCNATFLDDEEMEPDRDNERKITNIDLYKFGLSGGKDSAVKRKELLNKLNLPEYISTKELIKYINIRFTYDEFIKFIDKN